MKELSVIDSKKVCLSLTTKCNQKCVNCYDFPAQDNLPYEKNIRVLENLKLLGITKIIWSGGECLMVDKILNLLNHSKKLGMDNRLVTNGRLLTQEVINELCNLVSRINISVDSLDPRINLALGKYLPHEKLGDYEKMILDKLSMAKKSNLEVGAYTTVFKQNIDKIQEVGNMVNNLKVDEWHLQPFCSIRGQAAKKRHTSNVSKKKFCALFDNMKKQFPSLNITKQENIPHGYYVVSPSGKLILTQNNTEIELHDLTKPLSK